jgi:hypothetical protein
MEDLIFGNNKYELRYEPENEEAQFILERLDTGNGDDECLGMWSDTGTMLMDIDYGPVGEEISLEDWQKVWDWAHNPSFKMTPKGAS